MSQLQWLEPASGDGENTKKENGGNFCCHDSTAVTLGNRVNPLETTLKTNKMKHTSTPPPDIGCLGRWRESEHGRATCTLMPALGKEPTQ